MKTTSIGDKAVNVVFYIILSLLVIICFYPVWYAVLASFSDPTYINSGALILLPKKVNFAAYRAMRSHSRSSGPAMPTPFSIPSRALRSVWRSACRAATRSPAAICRSAA